MNVLILNKKSGQTKPQKQNVYFIKKIYSVIIKNVWAKSVKNIVKVVISANYL